MANKVKLRLTSRVGRLVGGHPMEARVITDTKTKQPKIDALGKPRTSIFVAVAIPKAGESHWNQTPEGKLVWQAGQTGYPAGEYNSPTFAWKVEDGDSAIPNKKGKKNCDREGYPGHWIFKLSTEISYPCHHVNMYKPEQQIQNASEIKRGDYVRVQFDTVDNAPSESPGVYINPVTLELSRQGEAILGGGADAEEAFGSPEQLYGATSSPAAPAPQAAGELQTVPGCQWSYATLKAGGWTDDAMREKGYLAPLVVAAPVPAPAAAAPSAPSAPAAPSAPVAPAHDLIPNAAPTKQSRMTAAAQFTYDQYIASQWTDEQLIANGLMV